MLHVPTLGNGSTVTAVVNSVVQHLMWQHMYAGKKIWAVSDPGSFQIDTLLRAWTDARVTINMENGST